MLIANSTGAAAARRAGVRGAVEAAAVEEFIRSTLAIGHRIPFASVTVE